MLRATVHGDVTRLRCSSWTSRLLGLDVSAYVVRGVLIDCGFPAMGAELARWLDEARLDGAMITHAHEDHAGNVDRLVAHGLPVGLPTETLERLRRPAPVGLYRRLCWGTPRALPRDPEPFAHERLTLLATPGHSTDHHVVWDPERETVFGGDLFMGVKVRVAHVDEDIRTQVIQLRMVAALAPRRYFDAHRGPVERPVEALRAKAQWIEETIGLIEQRAAAGDSARAIERAVLGAGDTTGRISRGDYAKRNLIASVLERRAVTRAATVRPAAEGEAP